MPVRDPRLRAALTAALLAGVGCAGSSDESGQDSDSPDPQLIGVEPAGLEDVCAATSLLGMFALPDPVDFLALRAVTQFGATEQEQTEAVGTACATATNVSACEAELATTWPTSTGWGYCGEGCTDRGLVWTRGDEVGLADAPAEVASLFGTIDAPAEVLMQVTANNYMETACETMRELEDGAYQLEAVYLVSDCEWTEETRLVQVAPDGELTVIEVLDTYSDGSCAGRRPDGLCASAPPTGDAVARQLANLARLEAAAVVAFERLAIDLERLDAPKGLVERAREAALDEVRHASVMRRLAEAHGGEVGTVEVAPHRARSLVEIARENAVEGCVRETFGVVDAMYRATHAPTLELRDAFAEIAADEARHAELSWDIAAWMDGRLSGSERDEIEAAMGAAYTALAAEIRRARPEDAEVALGAPSKRASLAMLGELEARLAA